MYSNSVFVTALQNTINTIKNFQYSEKSELSYHKTYLTFS